MTMMMTRALMVGNESVESVSEFSYPDTTITTSGRSTAEVQ